MGLWHELSEEEKKNGYQVSDSEVVDALRILSMYADQVKAQRTTLYFDAKKKGNENAANEHLRRYQQAEYMSLGVKDLRGWYFGTK